MTTTDTQNAQQSERPEQSEQTEAGEQRVPIRFDQSQDQFVNVGTSERQWSTYGGAALLLLGLARGRLSGLALTAIGGGLVYRGLTGHCALYSRLGMNTVDEQDDAAKPSDYFNRSIHVEHSVTIARDRAELFRFWRQFDNLPKFMNHLESVTCQDDGKRSHWVAKGPAGTKVEWDAEIINEVPDELIAWRSLGGAEVDNAGSVRFLPAAGDRGTEVRVVIDYIPPAGKVGAAVAKLFGEEPETQVREDLRRFKKLMETGENLTIEGQPRGSCGG